MDIQKLGHSIAHAARYQKRYLAHHFNPLNMGPRTLPFYMSVVYNEGISQTQLMTLLITDKTRTTKAINHLATAGYVRRKPDPKDNRIKGVYLTAKGKRILPEVLKVLDRLDGILSNELSKTDLNQFMYMLDAFAAAVGKELETLP